MIENYKTDRSKNAGFIFDTFHSASDNLDWLRLSEERLTDPERVVFMNQEQAKDLLPLLQRFVDTGVV